LPKRHFPDFSRFIFGLSCPKLSSLPNKWLRNLPWGKAGELGNWALPKSDSLPKSAQFHNSTNPQFQNSKIPIPQFPGFAHKISNQGELLGKWRFCPKTAAQCLTRIWAGVGLAANNFL
jgi:hypothetical protein